MKIYRLKLMLFLLSLLINITPTVRSFAQSQLSMNVYLEQESVNEQDSVKVNVLLSNVSDINITNAQLNITAPDFFRWTKAGGTAGGPVLPAELKEIPPHSMKSLEYWLKLKPGVRVGEFNILFTAAYEWKKGNTTQQSYISAEKKIHVNLFGSDTIIGIPLAFASLIVPGLAFLFILRLFKVPFGSNIGSEEKLVFSVLASGLILLLSYILQKLFSWRWLNNLTLGTEISSNKFIILTLAGVFFGVFTGLIYFIIQKIKRMNERSKIINPAKDSATEMLKKILLLNPDYNGTPVIVKLKNGEEFVGSHFAKSLDSTFLAGSFEVKQRSLNPQLQERLKKYLNNGCNNFEQSQKSLLEVIKIIAEEEEKTGKNIISLLDPITKNMQKQSQDFMVWNNNEICPVQQDYSRKPKLLELRY